MRTLLLQRVTAYRGEVGGLREGEKTIYSALRLFLKMSHLSRQLTAQQNDPPCLHNVHNLYHPRFLPSPSHVPDLRREMIHILNEARPYRLRQVQRENQPQCHLFPRYPQVSNATPLSTNLSRHQQSPSTNHQTTSTRGSAHPHHLRHHPWMPSLRQPWPAL